MNKAITESDVRFIVEMIIHWPKGQPFKWDTICQGSKSILGYQPTRQALHKKPTVVNAYDVKKKHLRAEVDKLSKVARPRSILEAMERLAKLESENDQLRAEVQRMAEVANRFIFNASLKGLSPQKLMQPLPSKN